MRILVDADACPVREEVVRLARPLGMERVGCRHQPFAG